MPSPSLDPFLIVAAPYRVEQNFLSHTVLRDQLCKGYQEEGILHKKNDLRPLFQDFSGLKFLLGISAFTFIQRPSLTEEIILFLKEKFQFSLGKQLEDIIYSLHEILVNAAFHGNLRISAHQRQNLYNLTTHISDQLSHHQYAFLAIDLLATLQEDTLTFYVQDQGIWKKPDTTKGDFFGRGLILAKAAAHTLVVDESRSLVTLAFRITP